MTLQRTLSIIKPDATQRNITGAINKIIEENGLRIIAQKRIRMNKELAEKFYDVHKDRPFFSELVESMTSAPVVVQILAGKDAVSKYRKIMGATNPAEAEEGTIRKEFALSIGENSVHGSDSLENAEQEIRKLFSEKEIVG